MPIIQLSSWREGPIWDLPLEYTTIDWEKESGRRHWTALIRPQRTIADEMIKDGRRLKPFVDSGDLTWIMLRPVDPPKKGEKKIKGAYRLRLYEGERPYIKIPIRGVFVELTSLEEQVCEACKADDGYGWNFQVTGATFS